MSTTDDEADSLLPQETAVTTEPEATTEPYPPTHQLLATKVLFECRGTGSPTVILETGLGAYRKISFRDQFYTLANKTRTCWYDRPGYGYSSPLISSDVQSISLVSNNLWSLLNAAGERGPFVLVGHSMGGLFVRDFAMDHMSNVSGIMLIDVMSEYQGPNPMWFRNLCLAVNAVSSLIPSVGALVTLASDAMYKWKEEDVVHYMNDVWCKTAVSESLGSVGIVNEGGDGIREFIRKVESMPNGFGEIPMTVMTSGDSVNGTCGENGHGGHCSLISDLPVHGKIVTEDGTYVYFNNSVPADTLNDTLGWHRDQAALSTDNLWEIYPTSNHFIMNDHEDRVLDRMKELVDRARIYWRNTVKS
ncbi:hypothetical protein HDU79_007080 [Rhizoclosmatium sp. JEL0117]|nr:hypothetical protein HDU79_007080 [Rhizoclosmatium sp. JEL0117]